MTISFRGVYRFLLIFGALLLSKSSLLEAASESQTDNAASRQIVFPKTAPFVIDTEAAPTIDGNLDDAVWQRASRISDFHQTRPVDQGEPTEKTQVQIARDENFIYVAFRAYDSEVSTLVAKGMIQGQSFFSDDRVTVLLDTFNDRRNSYFFQVNANGIRRDALVGNDYFIDDWDTVWFAESEVHDWGWSAEMAIPLKSIGFDPKVSIWGLNLTRINPRRGEAVAWSSLDRNINPSAFGTISNMQDFSQGRGIELNPSLSLVYNERPEFSNTSLEPSLTGFYNLTPFLTAGATFNTDFSATEADERQVNLDRFSLFFPEKRDFFLRDASIFEFGGLDQNASPFFSRRIGLSNDGSPLDLNAGFRLSGRAGDWNLGALAVQQDVNVDGADDTLFVGRATRNVFNESEVGLITTSGDPNSDSNNSLVGIDYTYRNSQVFGSQRVVSNFWYQQTDSDQFDDEQRAFGARLSYPNYSYNGELSIRRIEQNFNPALGFVNRSGVNQIEASFRRRFRLENSFWDWLASRAQYFRSDRIGGGIQTERTQLNLISAFSTQNDFATLFVVKQKEGLLESFQLPGGIVVPAGEYDFTRYGVFFETGVQRPLQLIVELADGDFFNGTRRSIEPRIDWRPSKHFYGSISYRNNKIETPAGKFTSELLSLRANYALNSKWAWLNLVQGDNVSDTVSINSRIRYQPRADREFFLVFNQTRDRVSDEITDTALIFKASINFRL